jgi:type IV pilus assembly protein PilE
MALSGHAPGNDKGQGKNIMKLNRMRGFTLIELMIVVALIGIIVALGYPSYRDQVIKSRRAEGMGELLELADRLERHYSDTGTYDDVTVDDIFHASTAKGYYTLAIDPDPSKTNNVKFFITATPKNGQEKDKCHTFTLDSLGTRGVTDGSLGRDDCWK